MGERDDTPDPKPSDSPAGSEPSATARPARDRDAILARRRFFVASALASVVATGCDKVVPQPCLEVMPVADGGHPTPCLSTPMLQDAEPAPMPCLEVARPPEGDAGSTFAQPPPEPPEPQVCLRVAAPRKDAGEPAPRPCLKVAVPDDPLE